MTDHETQLREKGAAFEQARAEAERIVATPRDELIQATRHAYADGVKKSTIRRWMGHVWSDTWVDKILKDVEQKPKTDQQD
ncbi:hypothetical protein ABZ671_01280 [Micromonospora sp. NPDC006766]|uniref:hypothetical protein n=1 Tax=Micromonospora sp. NPDC006766 TaxID=3154778 RepID=UPI003411CFE0